MPKLDKFPLEEWIMRAKKIGDESSKEAADTDSTDKFPVETLLKITENHLLSVGFPALHYGAGLGLEAGTNYALLCILKHLGRGNLVIGRVYEGHINAILLMALFGSNEQIRDLAVKVKNGGLLGVWNTQGDDGVNLMPLENGNFKLHGAKIFASGVDYVTYPIVTGTLPDGGWQMCIVPVKKANIKAEASWWNPMGMRATRSFKVDFNNCEVERKRLIGLSGDYYRQPWFTGGAIRFAAVQLGAAEAIFDETRKYLQLLNRTNDPYQKMRLGEMAILIETGNLWLKSAADKIDNFIIDPAPLVGEVLLVYANMIRTEIEKICEQVVFLCEKSVGARGLNKPFHMERIIRDLTIYLRQPAPDMALADVGFHVLQTKTSADNLWKGRH